MKETERRIKQYQKILPGLKAKLSMAAMMFVIAIVMMTSATFAWVTLSTKPEVTGIETTVTANGNLEIALSDTDGLEPDSSAVGDGALSIVERNLTWGNLVNLSDESYGLQAMVLQPATLNTRNLIDNPLYGALYGEDGRVTSTGGDFAYGNYLIDEQTGIGYFTIPETNQYGVRTIASITYGDATGEAQFRQMLREATIAANSVVLDYDAIIKNDNYMASLSGLMGKYVDAKLENTDQIDCSTHIDDLYKMYQDFSACLDTSAYVLLQYANMQQTVGIPAQHRQLFVSVEELFAAPLVEAVNGRDYIVIEYTVENATTGEEETKEFQIQLASLKQLKKDIAGMESCLEELSVLAARPDGEAVWWSEVEPCLDYMANTSKATLNGTPIGQLTADYVMDNLGDFLGTNDAVITEGALKNMEQRVGKRLEENKTSVTITVKGIGLNANVTTDAVAPFSLDVDLSCVEEMLKNAGGFEGNTAIAADTYGLAIDFWVRTNDKDSILVLEGEVESHQVQRVDKDGNPYYEDEDGNYYIQVTNSDSTTTYYDSYGTEVTDQETITTLAPVMDRYVTGYEGENRIWQDGILTEDSTTQGMGSCYVFYADSPDVQAQALTLLAEMKIVFIDDSGMRLATAIMDTNSAYEENGRVTVPIIVEENDLKAGDVVGSGFSYPYYGITTLEQSVPVRITALLYLDGADLSNKDVLAASDLEGKLNLQFGTNTELDPIDDKQLSSQILDLSASISANTFDYNPASPATATVTLNIDGVEPERVTANFSRYINETQGTRVKPELTFTETGEGEWQAVAQFAFPGKYVLRTVWLDGIEYELESPIKATVNGFTITSVGCQIMDDAFNNAFSNSNEAIIITDKNSINTQIAVSFGSSAYIPNEVRAVWSGEEGQQIYTDLTLDSGMWRGTSILHTSGGYELSSLIVDGEFVGIPTELQKQLTLYLGMKAVVQLEKTNIELDGQNQEEVGVTVRILDNQGDEIPKLNKTQIKYALTSSIAKTIDTDLTWNEENRAYEGIFPVKNPGVYRFLELTIGTGVVKTASSAPTLIAAAPDPAEFVTAYADEYQFAPNQDAYITFETKYANAASKAKVEFVNTDTKEVYSVEQVWGGADETTEEFFTRTDLDDSSGRTIWTAKVPAVNGSQEGTWRIQSVSLGGIYYNDQWHDDYVIWEIIPDEDGTHNGNNITTKVVNYVHVNVSSEKGSEDFSGYFMDDHIVTGTTIEVVDYEGEAIPNVENIELTYNLVETSIRKYGYTTTLGADVNEENPMTSFVAATSIPGKYVQKEDLNFKYAGEYTSQLTFTADGTNYMNGEVASSNTFVATGIPQYKVSWIAPLVTVSGVTINGTDVSGGVWKNPQVNAGQTASKDEMISTMSCTKETTDKYSKATIYIQAVQMEKKKYGLFGSRQYYYVMYDGRKPKVSLTLSNVGDNLQSASMTFIGGVDSTGANQERTYSFTSFTNGTSIATQEFGSVAGQSDTTETVLAGGYVYSQKYIFNTSEGAVTKKDIDVKYNNGTKTLIFTLDLDREVIINNPY